MCALSALSNTANAVDWQTFSLDWRTYGSVASLKVKKWKMLLPFSFFFCL